MTLREKHQQGKFTITVELDPPKSSSAQNVQNAYEPNFFILFVTTQ